MMKCRVSVWFAGHRATRAASAMPAPARPRGHAQTCAASRACPCRHPYPGTVNHPCVFSVREERSSPAKVACAPLARHSETTEHCARRRRARCRVQRIHSRVRSEEHTSELQSLMRISYAVFCLKKKKNKEKTMQNKRITTK